MGGLGAMRRGELTPSLNILGDPFFNLARLWERCGAVACSSNPLASSCPALLAHLSNQNIERLPMIPKIAPLEAPNLGLSIRKRATILAPDL